MMLCLSCGSEPAPNLTQVPSVPEEYHGCQGLMKAWCEHHIACGAVYDNVSECMGLISYFYCGSSFEIAKPEKGAACYYDLTTAECDSWEMSWPGSCYEALAIEEGC